MRNCRTDRLAFTLLGSGLLAAALTVGPAFAGTVEPPPGEASEVTIERAAPGVLPDAPQPPSPVSAKPKGNGRAVSGVEVQELTAPDPNTIGVLDDKQGGFGVEMWDGTAAVTVRRFLPHLPAAVPSRALRNLSRRLLLTAAALPPDDRQDQSPGQPSLLQLRAEALMAMGDLEGLTALLTVAPTAVMTPALSRLKLDSLLLAGETQAACAALAAAQAGGSDPALAKAQVFCHMAAGRTLEGNLALDLMRDRKDADHAFIAAAEVMGGLPPGRTDKLVASTPLHFAAFRAAKLPLPATAAETTQPAVLRAVAAAPNAPPEARLTAAEKAEAIGALDTETLRQAYAAVTFTPAELQAPLAQAATDKGTKARALLYRAAQQETQPAAKAEIVGRALKLATERGGFAATARLYAPLLADWAIETAPAGFTPVAARALYAAGQPEAALRWLAAARANSETAKEAAALWPLARLNAEEDRPAAAAIAAWREARSLPADQAERRAVLGLGLLAAVGEPIPAAEWLATLPATLSAPGGPQPRPALKAMLRVATDGLHLGETVLLTLVSLGDTGLDKADPDTILRAVAALRLLGLDKEARALAVEAALANGV
ncbi:MAG: antifreeze protein [Magnetospirillum sp.]|nr:antifreeze protein [Magnetospirillum sp.]